MFLIWGFFVQGRDGGGERRFGIGLDLILAMLYSDDRLVFGFMKHCDLV